jgi:hypothetical protein
MTIARRRGELDALRRMLCGFIQPVTEPAYHLQDANLSRCGEYHVQQNLAFDPKLASFGAIDGVRFTLD